MINKPGIELVLVFLILFSISLTSCLPVRIPDASTFQKTNSLSSVTDSSYPNLVLIPAFPGAEGFGSTTIGGRGGRVLEVTNLNDKGPGSLRAGVEASGPRIIVFRVAGTIKLDSSLLIINPYISIVGQTAPGEGITLRGVSSKVEALLMIKTHDVVIRFLTLRAGPPSAGDGIMVLTSNAHDTYNVVIDHNSVSWAVNRNLATWYDVHDISIQWNIFSEGLNCNIHLKGCHSKGVLLGGYASDENKDKTGAFNISFHHNLMAHNGERNPLVSTSGVTDVVNNIVYNPFGSFSLVDMQEQLAVIPVNFIGNYYKPGIDTDVRKFGIDIASQKIIGAQIYVQGNIGPHRLDSTQSEIDIVDPDARPYIVSDFNLAAPIKSTSAFEAYDQVLGNAGAAMGLNCDGIYFLRRDAIDTRIVNDVVHGTGNIIDDPSEVGGWVTIPSSNPCADSDQDGMPDAWEEIFGFNPLNPADSTKDLEGDGYLNIEEFLNGTNPFQ